MALLRNATTGQIIATRVERAATFLQRAFGLIVRGEVRPDEGLWFDRCNAVHTMGMRARIDLIFLDRDCRAIAFHKDVGPYRPIIFCQKAKVVVELGAGALHEHDLLLHDRLELVARADRSNGTRD